MTISNRFIHIMAIITLTSKMLLMPGTLWAQNDSHEQSLQENETDKEAAPASSADSQASDGDQELSTMTKGPVNIEVQQELALVMRDIVQGPLNMALGQVTYTNPGQQPQPAAPPPPPAPPPPEQASTPLPEGAFPPLPEQASPSPEPEPEPEQASPSPEPEQAPPVSAEQPAPPPPVMQSAPQQQTEASANIFAGRKAPLPPRRPKSLEDAVTDNGTEGTAGVEADSAAEPASLTPEQEEQKKFNALPAARSASFMGASSMQGDAKASPEIMTILRRLIAKHAAANEIPLRLANAVIRIESGYDPDMRRDTYMGLSQIHARTAQELGYMGNINGLLDPDINLKYGMRYFAMAYRLANGDACGAIMRYRGELASISGAEARRAYCNKVNAIIAESAE